MISAQKYKFAVIVLHWGKISDTLECLDSVAKHCTKSNYFVMLVDNTPDSQTNQIIEDSFDFTVLKIQNNENLGFAVGNNKGIECALKYNPEYIVLLNNDTVLINNDLENLMDVFDVNKEFGILGLVNYYYDHPEKVWQAGTKINHITGMTAILRKPNLVTQNRIIETDNVPGSALAIPAELLDKTGLFDANYYNYWEETDLCYRAKQLGYKVGLPSNFKILHKKTKVRTSTNALHNYFIFRNKLYYFSTKSRTFLIVFLTSCVKALTIGIYSFLMGGRNNFKAFFYALKDFFTGNMGKGSMNKIIGDEVN